jgi:hypothetical protein
MPSLAPPPPPKSAYAVGSSPSVEFAGHQMRVSRACIGIVQFYLPPARLVPPVFHSGIRPWGLSSPGRSVGPPRGNLTEKFFFAPDSILIARRSERRTTIRFSLRLCDGGREEGTGEDGDEGRSDSLGWK